MDSRLPKIVPITRVVRRMRGGSQSQLIQGQDGSYYIVKFAGNPQGTRTLISEWIGAYLLSELGIRTPRLGVLRLPESLDRSELFFLVGNRRKPVEGMLHLGSECPVNPDETAIFDFLPSALFPRITNVADFGRVFVFDCWLGQSDSRQALYARTKRTSAGGWFVWMIDHGQILGGSAWDLRMANGKRSYFDLGVYKQIDMAGVVEQTVQAISAIKEETLYVAIEGIPEEWFAPGDREALSHVLDHVLRRRKGLTDFVVQCWAKIEQSCSCGAFATKS